jgi:hypothetical protein
VVRRLEPVAGDPQKWSLLTWTIALWLGTLGTMVAMLKL